MKLVDKDQLIKEIDEAIKDFVPKNEGDQAFLEGVIATRRIVKFAKEAQA